MSRAGWKVRFAIGEPLGRRGTSWSVWTHKSDIYVASRGSNGLAKVSLHESGQCHTKIGPGILQRVIKAGGPEATPYMNRWDAGLAIDPGCDLKFRIICPLSDLRPFRTADETEIEWITPDWEGKPDLIVGIVRSDPAVLFQPHVSWPGRRLGVNLFKARKLPNGQGLWLVYMQDELPPDGLSNARRQLERDVAGIPEHVGLKGDLRANVVVTGTDEVGGLLELAVTKP